MTFTASSIEVAGPARHGVRLKLKGTKSWSEGEYTNERNTSKTITVSEHRAKEIRDDLDEILDD